MDSNSTSSADDSQKGPRPKPIGSPATWLGFNVFVFGGLSRSSSGLLVSFWVRFGISGFLGFFCFWFRVGFFAGSWFSFRFSWVFMGFSGFVRVFWVGFLVLFVFVFVVFVGFVGFVLCLSGFLFSLGLCVFLGLLKRVGKHVAGEPIIGAFLPMG